MVKDKTYKTKRKFISRDNSKSIVTQTSWKSASQNIFPNFSLNKCVAMVENDPMLSGAIEKFVGKCMEGDIVYLKRDSNEEDKSAKIELERQFMFRTKILRKVFKHIKLFNQAFIEVVRNKTNKDTKDLNVLYTPYVQPKVMYNGDPVEFQWVYSDPLTGEKPVWSNLDITWIKYGDMGNGYAFVNLKALWELLHLKEYVLRFTSWLWETGQYKSSFNFESGGTNVEDFLTYARKASKDYTMPYITKGDFNHGVIRDIKETDSIERLLSYIDVQMLALIGIPPVDAGLPDASGRSNADAQSNAFITSILDVKKVVEDYINYDLFPKINRGNTLIKFGPSDRFNEKSVWEIVQKMDSVGVSKEYKEHYLKNKGIVFNGEMFNTIEEIETATNPQSVSEAPSKQGKGASEGNKTHDEVTTREDQLKRVD